jgi:hypothetical protein
MPVKYPPQQGWAWREGWQERLYSLIRERGFASVTEYADSRPSATLLELADNLGSGEVAAIQVRWRLVAEAEANGTIERCAQCLLVRTLHDELPEGWQREWKDIPGDPSTPFFRKVGAFSDVVVALPDQYADAMRRIRLAFDAADIPEGWLPESPDDPVIAEMFRRHWSIPP